MKRDVLVAHVVRIASELRLPVPDRDWRGVDAVWPLLEKIRDDGAIVLLKLDGERTGENDNGPYTVLASGLPLPGGAIRTDSHTLEEGLSYVICHYAAQR